MFSSVSLTSLRFVTAGFNAMLWHKAARLWAELLELFTNKSAPVCISIKATQVQVIERHRASRSPFQILE